MSINQLRLVKFNIGNSEEELFLLNAFNSPDALLFWSTSGKKYEDIKAVLSQLDRNLGDYKIFLGLSSNVPKALFIAHGISYKNGHCEILAYIDLSVRRKASTYLWWVMLLERLHQGKINRIFAKIFSSNIPSKSSAVQAGFVLCGILPEYMYDNGKAIDIEIYTRETKLTEFESYWLAKITNYDKTHLII